MTAHTLLDFTGRRSTPLIQQSEASECGLACLAMVAGHHGLKTDLAALRMRFSLSLRGMTLKTLNYGANYGRITANYGGITVTVY